jgi:hypothetical protein
MAWVLVSPRCRRHAAGWAAAGTGSLAATALLGSLSVSPGPLFWGAAGFVTFVAMAGKALALLRVDDMVFDPRPRRRINGRSTPGSAFPAHRALTLGRVPDSRAEGA